MLTWPHSGFHGHTAVWVPEDDRAFATRLARYGARNPVALERRQYDRAAKAVTSRSEKSEGPTAGPHGGVPPMGVVAFIAQASVIDRILAHLRTRTSRVAHPGAARGRSAGTFGVRGGPIGASCQLPPTPARRCSRGGRPPRILDRPRLNFLSGKRSLVLVSGALALNQRDTGIVRLARDMNTCTSFTVLRILSRGRMFLVSHDPGGSLWRSRQ